jgi:5,10-methylenetetrahydrofolate reductase
MSLGILSRMGVDNLLVTTGDAPAVEDDLCNLVGFITQEIVGL